MKYVIAMTILTMFSVTAFPSCLVSVGKDGKGYSVSVWKHREDVTDTVTSKDYLLNEMSEVGSYLKDKARLVVIFNEGVFTSLQFDHEGTKRWANLTNGEKDLVLFIQNKFDIGETTNKEK